ncbi:MAG: ABC transporter permease [Acidimicrobiales bacterium]
MAVEPEVVLIEAGEPVAPSLRVRGLWRDAFRETLRKKSAFVGLILLGILVVLAVLAPVLAPFGERDVRLEEEDVRPREAPCVHLLGCDEARPQHILGLDGNGRDVLSRILFGARLSLIAGFVAVFFAVVLGTSIGLVSGFFGRWVDAVIMRVMDVLLAFPALLLAVAIAAALQAAGGKYPFLQEINERAGIFYAVIAVSAVTIPVYARLVRASTLAIREQDFITADRALGVPALRILLHRVLPNALTPLVVQATLGIATAVLELAALSFLGLGGDPSQAEWGRMIALERNQIFTAPHLVLFPGLMIMVNVLAFNLIGDGLRDALDPRLNR